eukprot:TRINITY_DN8817_c0_g1_i4.p1 TRINITY_DN8817_c0_g1~~TRINITY_DN8817_c0_g1_i4.p1  ORF type:complete len:208 (+),score=34.71 TRINITY_DN8817_c0_g1_i4:127-750(+)
MPAVTNAFLRISIGMHGLGKSCAQIPQRLILPLCSSSSSCSGSAGVNAGLVEFVLGKRKATDVAHLVWQEIVKGGDFVIDATCGNGNDTFALSKLVCLDSGKGLVYGMDVQEIAIQNTSFLLDTTLNPKHRQQVKLFELCHSKMETVIPKGIAPRLVAFNLGYLPGGNKNLITRPGTTITALETATKILESGGLVSVVSYVGHQGGW